MDKKHPDDTWISSRELMEKQGISRGTLNNYIKAGLLPRPVVGGAREGMKGTKKIGYFPPEAAERMERIRRLKENGKSMEEVAAILKAEAAPAVEGPRISREAGGETAQGSWESGGQRAWVSREAGGEAQAMSREADREVPRVCREDDRKAQAMSGEAGGEAQARSPEPGGETPPRTRRRAALLGPGEDIPYPAYSINQSLRILWLNRRYKNDFMDIKKSLEDRPPRGGETFPGFLGAAWQERWIDSDAVLDAHVAMMKTVFSREGVILSLDGPTGDSVARRWERVAEREKKFALTVPLRLEKREGGTESFLLHGLRLRKEIVFVWETVPPEAPGGDSDPLGGESAAAGPGQGERGTFIVVAARMEGLAELCVALPSREYAEFVSGAAREADGVIRRQGGVPGNAGEGRFRGVFPWSGFTGETAGKAIGCALLLKDRISAYCRSWSDRKRMDIPVVLNTGVAWGSGVLEEAGPGDRAPLAFTGQALRRSAGLADLARGGAVLAMKELVEKAEDDRCPFHYGVLKRTAGGVERREGVYFRAADGQDAGTAETEEAREAAFLAVTEIFGIKEKE
ncbi:MAG TPA: MerR family transcriptional regulator [Syntrophales bacterium]|nr:MerR family transcriptional regulator [Syntrophales bacterium]